MKNVLIISTVFSMSIYIVFAVFPETLGIVFFPTGGWDWLSYIGILFGVIIASNGISKTIESENNLVKKQTQLNNIPCLNSWIHPEFRSGDINVYRKFEDNKDLLINNGFIQRDTDEVPQGFETHMNLIVNNIGLSAASTVEIYLHRIKKIRGLSKLDDFATCRDREIIDYIYDLVEVSPYTYIEGDTCYTEEWQILAPINLPNDRNFKLSMSFDLTGISGKYFNIIEYRFHDIFENEYFQLQYVYFDAAKRSVQGISKVYTGKNYKDR